MALYMMIMLLTLASGKILRQPTLPVKVEGGLVRGSVASDGSHLRYTGIPYGVARQRFQPAEPAPKWQGVFEATDEYNRCPQKFQALVIGDEDCLKINVYTPMKTKNANFPVMVFIHGGGFKEGSGSPTIYGPEHLVRFDVILVTFNYRLGVLGFLCLGTDDAPGNVGLKDQVLALRWVKNNIKAFGGDPSSITIFGESAGSSSVMYHILSPMSTGLFHRAIMESGSAISYWSLQFEPKELAIKFAAQMGYNMTDVNEIVKILKQKSFKDLLNTQIPRAYGEIVQSENIFVPCIEKPTNGSEAFITDSPYNIITKGNFNKVPVIMGFNSAEGYYFIGKENASTISQFNFMDALPRDLVFPTRAEKETTSARFLELYVDVDQKINLQTLIRYEGDAGIRYPVIASTDLLLKNMDKPVFVYKFAYSGLLNLIKIANGFALQPGASHADELFYIFKPRGTTLLSIIEMNMVSVMTTMWINFAKYEKPVPFKTKLLPEYWYPVNFSDPQLMVIDKSMSMERFWDDEAILYWNETYTYYRRTN